jgi:hypothetical protein
MVASFHPKTLPPMLRRNYALELWAWWFLPMMLAAVEGGAIGNIVKKAFTSLPGVPERELNFAVAAVVAAPSIASITSFVWAWLSHAKVKVRFIVGLQLGTAILVGLIGLASASRGGLWFVVAMVIASRICWTGVITLRSAIWGANYPRADRARIAGKLSTIFHLVMAPVGILIGLAMDWDEESFHWLFPLTALLGLIGIAIYRGVRLRGQKRLMRAERNIAAHERPSLNPLSIYRVLAQDKPFRRYMMCMFVFGLGNLMITAPLAIVLHEVFDVDYTRGILITTVIPSVLMPMSIPFWSRLIARFHVIEFRAIHAWSYVSASLLFWLGVMLHRIELLYLAAAITGIANGGGFLAWNLGHHDFAPAHRDSQYMGVHVTLTGIRGIIAPIAGVGLYEWFGELGAAGHAAQDAAAAAQFGGSWIFAVTFLLNAIGGIGFVLLSRGRRAAARQSL